jgi:hypothetical protein
MGSRSWTHHLRLLPGGDSDLTSALVTTCLVYLVLLLPGLIAALALESTLSSSGVFSRLSVANGVPWAVIGVWTGLRVRSSRWISPDEAAVDLDRRRVFYGDEVGRVPARARVFSIRSRQATTTLADGRRLVVLFRVNADPDDLVALARATREGWDGEGTVEALVDEHLRAVPEMLPDVDGIETVLRRTLLKKGILLSRVELERRA